MAEEENDPHADTDYMTTTTAIPNDKKTPEHDQNMEKQHPQQQHGISYMTLTGTKYSHGPTNEFRYINDAAAGSLFT
jgi:hypothetical protein